MRSKKSQRFESSPITEKLVPALFVLILIGLLAVLLVTGMAMAGLTPGI